VLEQLGLEGTEDVLIGSPEKKGISGGQRKRVNLAMELLTDPLVLFLDEPTSGLSSEDALMVMKVLRDLANAGKTILLTIHQPSLEVFRLMDNLVVVARDAGSPEPGRLAYYGPAYPDAVHFFNPAAAKDAERSAAGPDEVLRGLAGAKASEWVARYRTSTYQRKYVEERAGKKVTGAKTVAAPVHRHSGLLAQWWTLVRRALAIKATDTWNTAILLAQAPVIAILTVMVYGHTLTREINEDNPWPDFSVALGQSVFLTVLSALWFGCANAIREIVGEWAIYQRERMVVLKLWPYVASKFTILGLLCFFQCLVFAAITHFFGGLAFTWAGFGLLFLVALVGSALGLTISAAARTSEVAIALLPLALLPMVIFGGGIRPVYKMPSAVRGVCNAMPPRWAFEGILILQSDRQARMAAPGDPAGKQHDMAERFFPEERHRSGPGVAALVLAAMLLFLFGAIHVILRRRDLH